MKKVLTMMAVAAFFAMSATACGGEDKEADGKESGEEAQTERPSH